LPGGLGRFSLGLWFFGLRNFDSAGAPTNDVGANAALHNSFTRLNLSQILVLGLHDPIGDNFLFTHMDLGLLLSGQDRAHPRYLILLKRTLRLAPSDAQLIKLCDEILGLYTQFFCQQMDSCLSHLILPVSLLQILNEFFLRFLFDLSAKRSIERLSPYESLPALLDRM
jgi:hypothetical protein